MWRQLKAAGWAVLEELATEAVQSIGGSVVAAVEHVAEAGLRWVIRLALAKIVGVILGVTALVFLLTAGALGLQALGVHPALANLGAAAVAAGLGAWFFFARGNRSFAEELNEHIEKHAGEKLDLVGSFERSGRARSGHNGHSRGRRRSKTAGRGAPERGLRGV
jgi:hypothetical protein